MINSPSCKYEDGPAISLRSAQKRIAGTYDVEKFSINGYDSTFALKSKPCYGRLTFDTNNIYGNRGSSTGSSTCEFEGAYGLSDGNRKITLKFYTHFPEMPPLGIIENTTWDIKELRNDEMTFEIVYNGKICVLKLKE